MYFFSFINQVFLFGEKKRLDTKVFCFDDLYKNFMFFFNFYKKNYSDPKM